jgi:hypothetical protein
VGYWTSWYSRRYQAQGHENPSAESTTIGRFRPRPLSFARASIRSRSLGYRAMSGCRPSSRQVCHRAGTDHSPRPHRQVQQQRDRHQGRAPRNAILREEQNAPAGANGQHGPGWISSRSLSAPLRFEVGKLTWIGRHRGDEHEYRPPTRPRSAASGAVPANGSSAGRRCALPAGIFSRLSRPTKMPNSRTGPALEGVALQRKPYRPAERQQQWQELVQRRQGCGNTGADCLAFHRAAQPVVK